jgi:hypothetical protein
MENVYLGLAKVFQGIPPIIKEPKGKILDGFLFLITPHDNKPPLDFLEVDISIY